MTLPPIKIFQHVLWSYKPDFSGYVEDYSCSLVTRLHTFMLYLFLFSNTFPFISFCEFWLLRWQFTSAFEIQQLSTKQNSSMEMTWNELKNFPLRGSNQINTGDLPKPDGWVKKEEGRGEEQIEERIGTRHTCIYMTYKPTNMWVVWALGEPVQCQ